MDHSPDLLQAASDGKLWELWYTSVPSKTDIDTYLGLAMQQKKEGTGFPFVVVDKRTGDIIGSTRFCNYEKQSRRVEIGYTWYAARYQRTGVNTQCKFLLLEYAYEVLGCIAVEFRTNWFNLRSRTAIARLGARQDGVLRNHRINPDGTYRDTVVFSILESEWPSVSKSLRYSMDRKNS